MMCRATNTLLIDDIYHAISINTTRYLSMEMYNGSI